jgi:hypothetical protein
LQAGGRTWSEDFDQQARIPKPSPDFCAGLTPLMPGLGDSRADLAIELVCELPGKLPSFQDTPSAPEST